MIKNNVKLGNTTIDTVIEMGEGDIQVAAITYQDSKKVGVEFMNDVPTEIGTKHNTVGSTTDNSRPQAIMSFTKVESIDVVIKHLKNAKIKLRNM